MTLHNDIRDDIVAAALAAGIGAETEASLNGWPAAGRLGRIDVLIHYPRTGVEVKVDAAAEPTCPVSWRKQLDRYRELIGTASGLWLVSTTIPEWADFGFFLKTGCRVTTVTDFKARLARFGRDRTPLPHVFRRSDVEALLAPEPTQAAS